MGWVKWQFEQRPPGPTMTAFPSVPCVRTFVWASAKAVMLKIIHKLDKEHRNPCLNDEGEKERWTQSIEHNQQNEFDQQ
tara:strand:+ start:498 stop:734 length:237 start_codon:yes stop_codon:yes gene_type:complete